MEALLQMLTGEVSWAGAALGWLGVLVVLGQGVVLMTPTKKDDEALAKAHKIPVLGDLLKAIAAFAPIQKKEKKG